MENLLKYFNKTKTFNSDNIDKFINIIEEFDDESLSSDNETSNYPEKQTG